MRGLTILAVSADANWVSSFWSDVRSLPGARLVATRSLEEATDLLDCAHARLIAVDWKSLGRSWSGMDELLWGNSILSRQARVLVADDSYDDTAALRLFREGVDEYVSMADHLRSLPMILARLLGMDPERLVPDEPAVTGVSGPGRLTPLHGTSAGCRELDGLSGARNLYVCTAR